MQFSLLAADAAIRPGQFPSGGTPAGILAIPACDLQVHGARSVTVAGAAPKTGQETLTLEGHTNRVWSVAFSADGKRIAFGSWDGTVKVWDAQTRQEVLTYVHVVAGEVDDNVRHVPGLGVG